jgi:V/A-type H+-transporting ATPase subunit I
LPLGLPENPLYSGFHRVGGDNTVILLGATVIIGLLHLSIGFIFGAINEWNHNRKHAYAKLGWLGIIIGIFAVIGSMLGILIPEFTVIGGVLMGISVVVIAACEGLVGIVELPGLAGNILSYTRIAAVGVSGVLIAELVNHNFLPVPEAGLTNLLLIPVFVLLHFVNCFIAMFEGLVQSGRLNIVEFKSKFLHGGRELFAPFKMR